MGREEGGGFRMGLELKLTFSSPVATAEFSKVITFLLFFKKKAT